MRLRWGFRSPHVRCFSVNHVTGERVKGAIAAPLTIPAPGKENRRCAVPSAYSLRLSGRGGVFHPFSRPPPACGQRLSDFQPDQGIAIGAE